MRDLFLPITLVVIVILLLSRLFYLQILQGGRFRYLSNNNRIKTGRLENHSRGVRPRSVREEGVFMGQSRDLAGQMVSRQRGGNKDPSAVASNAWR